MLRKTLALLFAAVILQPLATAQNLIDEEFFGFEGPITIKGEVKNWFLLNPDDFTHLAIVDERAAQGINSLKFTHTNGVENVVNAFAPPGSVVLGEGEFVVRLDVWVDIGSNVGRLRPILESPFVNVTPINLHEIPQGQWVTVTSLPFTRDTISADGDRLRLQVRPGDMFAGTGTFYVDNVQILAYTDDAATAAFPTPYSNVLESTLASFEPNPPQGNWFISSSNGADYSIINSADDPSIKVADGTRSLVLDTPEIPAGFNTAFAPNGSVDTLYGDYTVSMDVWVEPGSSVTGIRAILEQPFSLLPTFDIGNIVQGQWVTITSQPVTRNQLSGNGDRIRVQFRPDDFSEGSSKVYIDNVTLKEHNPRLRFVQGLSLSPAVATVYIDRSTQLEASLTPANPSNPNITWSSTDPAVASVDAQGLVTGHQIGTATITAVTQDGGFFASSQVTVQEYRNFANSPGFEDDTWQDSWTGLVGQAFIVSNAANVNSGEKALRLRNTTNQDNSINKAYIEQTVALEPNTRYVASVWGRLLANGTDGIFGVKDYGSVTKTQIMIGAKYTQYSIEFVTGENDISATIFVENNNAANFFIDDVEVLLVPEIEDLYKDEYYDRVTTTYIGPIEQGVYLSLLQKVNDARDLLAIKIMEAEDAGVNTDYAQVSVTTIDWFKDKFAPWDRLNPLEVEEMYNKVNFSRFDPVGPEGLPFDQLGDSLMVAETAIAELDKQIAGDIILQTPPDFATGTVAINNGNYELNGTPIFASKFFFQPDDEASLQAYGRNGEKYLSVQDLESDTVVKEVRLNSFVRDISREVETKQSPIQLFLGHIVPNNSALRDLVPDAFELGTRMFTDYDIDNPAVKGWINVLFENMVQPNIDLYQGAPRIYMMANEPTFGFREGGAHSDDGISGFTEQKYQDWLLAKYESIAELNSVYGTAFNDFDELPGAYSTPLPLALQGGPAWYDWHIFNMDRVNDWFTYLQNTVKANDPDGLTHIKVLGERSIHGEYLDEGIDFEFVTKLVDVPGSDAQMTSFDAHWDVRRDQTWRNRWNIEWRAQSIMLDFMASIAPNKPLYDSEWHALSGSRWRDFHMSPQYVRESMWLAVTHGLDATTAWVWNRKEDGSIDKRADFVGTSVTQPIQLDAYGRAIKEINAHGELTMALVPNKRDFVIYYSKDSAIQYTQYTQDLSEVYEALKVLNLRVGFTTPTELKNVNISNQTLILPPTNFISKRDLAQLVAFSRKGGKVVKVTTPNSLKLTEIGQNSPAGLIAAIRTYATVEFDEVFTMANDFASALTAVAPVMKATAIVTGLDDSPQYGVLVNQVDNSEDGKVTVSLINISQQPLNVSLLLQGSAPDGITDLLTQQSESSELTLAPMDVRLLQLQGDVVLPPDELLGDFDSDLDIDKLDIRIFRAGIAKGLYSDLKYDFNKDGLINRRDGSALARLCTRSRCAT